MAERPSTCINRRPIRRYTKKASLSHTLTLKIISKIQVLFRRLIWPKRCSAQKEKESQAGINISAIAKAKRSQPRNSRSPRRHLNNPPDLDENFEPEGICLDDVLPSPSVTFRPDREGMASEWFIEGMTNWLTKGIKASWMFIGKETIGQSGNKLVSSFLSRTNTVQTDTQN